MPISSKTKVGVGVAAAGAAALLIQQLASPPPCASSEVCLTWVASDKYEDGTLIPAGKTITYKAYRDTPRTVIATTTALAARVPNQPRGVQYYFVTATVDGSESKDSGRMPKTIRFSGPTQGAIEAPTDGAVEPKK